MTFHDLSPLLNGNIDYSIIAQQLVERGQKDVLRALLLDYTYLQQKLNATNAQSLIADCNYFSDDETIQAIHLALRDARVLDEDKNALPQQLLWELMSYRATNQELRNLTDVLGTLPNRFVPINLDTRFTQTKSISHAGYPYYYWKIEQIHHEFLYTVHFSPDGHTLLSSAEDRTARIYSIATDSVERVFWGFTDTFSKAAFDFKVNHVVLADNDHDIVSWNLEEEKFNNFLWKHEDTVTHLVFSPKFFHVFASTSADNTIKMGSSLYDDFGPTFKGHTAAVNAGSFSDDSLFFASVSDDKTVRIWHWHTFPSSEIEFEVIRILEGHLAPTTSVAFTKDTTSVISASADGEIRVWNVEDGQLLKTIQGHAQKVNCVIVSPDDRLIVSASADSTIKVWEFASGMLIQTLIGHTDQVNTISFLPDSHLLLSASKDHTLKVWDVDTGSVIQEFIGHQGNVTSAAYDPATNQLYSVDDEGEMRRWNMTTMQPSCIYQGMPSIRCARYSPDGKSIAKSSWFQDLVSVWDLESGKTLFSINADVSSSALKFSPDGNFIVAGHSKRHENPVVGILILCDAQSGEVVRTYEGHTDVISCVAFTSDSRFLVSGSEDNTIKVWEVATGNLLASLQGNDKKPKYGYSIRDANFSPDGRFIVAALDDDTTKVWDATTYALVQTFRSEGDGYAAFFTHDMRYVVSAATTGLRLWDFQTGECVTTLYGSYYTADLSPTDNIIAVGSSDGTIDLLKWRIEK